VISFVLLCIAGLLISMACKINASVIFFGAALAWLAVSPMAPLSIYFHLSGIVSTISITFMSFYPSKAAERLVWCSLACVVLNAIDFTLYHSGSQLFAYTPLAFFSVYVAALLITIEECRNAGGYWNRLSFLSSNILARVAGR